MANVIITGASGDIGMATARLFASQGHSLALFGYQNVKKLGSLAEELTTAYNIQANIYTVNLSDPEQVSNAFKRVFIDFGTIDVLINNAGMSIVGLDQDLSSDKWLELLNTNLSSYTYCTRAIIPHMLKSHSGRIINISSMWGVVGASCEAAYSATKGGINAYTMALAKELAPSHIPVNAIAFGAIDTKMNSHLSPEEKASFEEEIPYGRMATPEEAAQMIYNVYTAPDYMTGQIISFTGGYI